ncbi:UrvD/REP family ATP-dependent DNA helicase [Trueperella bialowiezensis]|uniref:DNA 3'-5' helicase n=1 Tax=Trueperella bialowiezensis TaxID=312285 RepID=A0A3S4V7Y4_9ACTO|nr:UrvD/REP family ATP-dependent DNA helicase [Trueperella bialowiezensis]VEI13951.1 Inactivated superfamily I helicase [Trueperella bialowiezensis]
MRMQTFEWNPQQQAVLDVVTGRGAVPVAASVTGAPGSGKTALALAAVERIISENPEHSVALLSPDRRAAADLRNSLSQLLGYLPGNVQVQSITGFAFAIVSAYAQYVGRRPPELLSGPDQDAALKEYFDLIIAGQVPGTLPTWGDDDAVVQLPAYRAEFRDLLTRAAELGLGGDDLAAMGARHGEPVWEAGAQLLDGYEKTLALLAGSGHQNPDVIDHSRLIALAASHLRGWEGAQVSAEGALNMARPHWDWVIVDDVHNATLAVRELLAATQEAGSSIVTFGDPDVAVHGFRGGIAQLPALLRRDKNSGGIGAAPLQLSTRYRGGGQLGELVKKITGAIRTGGAGKHRAGLFAADEPGKPTRERADKGTGRNKGAERRDAAQSAAVAEFGVYLRAFANEDEEIAYVATKMRRLHLLEGVPYSRMALISRSSWAHADIRRSLIRYGVPVQAIFTDQPLREQRAVAALIELVNIALADPAHVDSQRVADVLTGPLIGITPLELRRLQRELRGWEIDAGGVRTDAELLADILTGGEVAMNVPEFARLHELLTAIKAKAEAGALGEEVMWTAWQGAGVADRWRAQALAGGIAGDGANEDLDTVISLFRIAQRQADRNPANASIHALLSVLESQDVAEDTIARFGAGGDEVTLCTPSSSIGRTWDYVAVVGINEGSWPNTRLRNPLTKVPKLVNIVVRSAMAGRDVEPDQSVSDVLDDELRMFLQAVTRAEREVWLTCQMSDTVRPSRFMTWLDPELELSSANAATFDANGLIGELRQAMASGHERAALAASQVLDALVAAGIADADPATWADQLEPSSREPVYTGNTTMSPSKVEGMLECPLRAFLDSAGARSTDDTRLLDLGTLIHSLAEEFPSGPRTAVMKAFHHKVAALDLGTGLDGHRARQRAEGMARKLGDYLEATDCVVVAEQYASEQLTNDAGQQVTTNARLDRLEMRDGQALVVDFKTGKNPVTKAQAADHAQLKVYQWLVNKGAIAGLDGAKGAKLVFVGTKRDNAEERSQAALSEEAMGEVENMIIAADQAQRGPGFAAIPNQNCRTCAYSKICPAIGNERVFS